MHLSKASGIGLIALLLVCGGTSSCVTENVDTGEMVPRGKQRYPWDTVVELAKQLQKGMNKAQVMGLMGSPAEIDSEDNQWIYLPERYAVLVPARALRLEFNGQILTDFGYRAIVLGAQL